MPKPRHRIEVVHVASAPCEQPLVFLRIATPRDGLDRNHFPSLARAAVFEERTKRHLRCAGTIRPSITIAAARRIQTSRHVAKLRKWPAEGCGIRPFAAMIIIVRVFAASHIPK